MVIRMKHEELEQILNDIDLTKEAPAQSVLLYEEGKTDRSTAGGSTGTQTDSVRGDIWLSDEC